MATLVEGDSKAPFSIATTSRCRWGATSFPGWLHIIFDPYLIILSAKQCSIKYHFLNIWYDSTWKWIPVSRTISEHFTLHFKLWIATNLGEKKHWKLNINSTEKWRCVTSCSGWSVDKYIFRIFPFFKGVLTFAGNSLSVFYSPHTW